MNVSLASVTLMQKTIHGVTSRAKTLRVWILIWTPIAFMVSGCSMVGPDFVQPEAPLLEDWMERQPAGVTTSPTGYSGWWRVFEDPILNQLIEKAYRQNLSLHEAGIRIFEARAQLGIAVGNLYPQQQSVSGDLTTNKLGAGANNLGIDSHFNAVSLGFDAAWEVDVWGKYRRSVQSGIANLSATVANYDNVLVSLTAEVARSYIVMRTLEERLVIAEENVTIQKKSLQIAEIRFNNGAVTELDVSQAKMLLGNTQALIPALKTVHRKTQNALATLLGVVPGKLKKILSKPAEIPVATETVVFDIPSNLLRRRPDIRLSELQLAAQSPQIGVAKADLYPHFYLFGSIGWSASDAVTASGQNSLGDIFSYKTLSWNAGPGFSWDFLNYGRIKNRVRVEDARFQQLVVSYKNTVLNAQREVEDAMVAYARSKEEQQFLEYSVTAARHSAELSMLQYREGAVDYQRVLDSQGYLASQEDRLTEVAGQVSTNLVATYKALGGGWQIREGKELLSEEDKNQMAERTSWGGLLDPKEIQIPVEGEESSNLRRPDW